MSEALPEQDVLPLSCLRLLVSPVQLMSAALWGIVQHRAVMHYGLLEDFITAVLDMIPDLLTSSEREQIVLGLRAKVVLEVCRSDNFCYEQNIEPYMKSLSELVNANETYSSWMKASVDKLSKVVNKLLEDPYERAMFYQQTFPSSFGHEFDSTLCALVRKFLMNLEKVIPVPSLDQTSQWLGLSPSVLKECGDILIQPELLSNLIHLHPKHEYKFSPGHFDDEGIIYSSFSALPDSDEEIDISTHLNSPYTEEDEKTIITDVTVSLKEGDKDPQDCNTSVAFVYQRQSDRSRTFSCLECGQSFVSLFEMKRHSISGCSANTSNENTQTSGGRKEEEANPIHARQRKRSGETEGGYPEVLEQSWSLDSSDGQMCKRSSRIKTCSVCGEMFTSSADLTNHMRGHTDDESHICSDCGKDFKNYESYMLHEENGCKRSREDSMDVDDCQVYSVQQGIKECAVILKRISDDGATTSKKSNLFSSEEIGESFLRTKLDKEKIKCFPKNRQKKNPIIASHPNLTLIKACHVSSSSIINKNNTEIESQFNQTSTESQNSTSSNQTLMKCTLCDQGFSKIILLRKHYYDSHNIKGSFQCPVCERVFVRLSDLVNHHQNRLLFQCDKCKRCFVSFSKLSNHRESYKDACAALHICEICHRTFKDTALLKKHQNAHKTEGTVCSYCGKNFSNKSSLQIHMNRHTGGFTCSVCAKVFFQKTALQRHMDRHNGQEPYLCEICGKGWATKAYLALHMVKHSEERPFKCDQCGLTTKRESHLKEHIRSKHTEHRPFKCSVCSKAFKVNYMLKMHMSRHAGHRPYACLRCGKSYYKKYELKEHLQKRCV